MHTVFMRNAQADESALQPLLTCIVCTGLRTRRPGFKVVKAGRTTVKLIMYHPSTGEFPATLKINKKGEGVSKCQGAVGFNVCICSSLLCVALRNKDCGDVQAACLHLQLSRIVPNST